jgi:hypothetical protein
MRLAHDGADDSIEAGTIASAGEYTDVHLVKAKSGS